MATPTGYDTALSIVTLSIVTVSDIPHSNRTHTHTHTHTSNLHVDTLETLKIRITMYYISGTCIM